MVAVVQRWTREPVIIEVSGGGGGGKLSSIHLPDPQPSLRCEAEGSGNVAPPHLPLDGGGGGEGASTGCVCCPQEAGTYSRISTQTSLPLEERHSQRPAALRTTQQEVTAHEATQNVPLIHWV